MPSTVSPSRSRLTSAPIWSSRSRSRSPACVVYCGQPGTRTRPPVTSGRGDERRGVRQVRLHLDVEGADRARARPASVAGSASSTTTPTSRSASTVMTTCGVLGIGEPDVLEDEPLVKRAPASSSPETNWLDAEASIAQRAAAHGARARAP